MKIKDTYQRFEVLQPYVDAMHKTPFIHGFIRGSDRVYDMRRTPDHIVDDLAENRPLSDRRQRSTALEASDRKAWDH